MSCPGENNACDGGHGMIRGKSADYHMTRKPAVEGQTQIPTLPYPALFLHCLINIRLLDSVGEAQESEGLR
jgi:hypothetical protein